MENKAFSSQLRVPELISKYMEYLDFVKNLSEHSIRAYATDLVQVFQIKNKGILNGPKINKAPYYKWEPKEEQTIKGAYDEWKDLALKSMRSWSHLSTRSKRRKMSSLSQFIEWLKIEENINFPLILPTTKPPAQNIPNFLSVDECLSIMSYLAKDPFNHEKKQQELLFYLLYGCGLRISEACSALSENVSIEKRTLKIMGKGKKERLVVLPEKVSQLLQKTLLNKTKYLFGDKALPTRTGYERIRQLGKASLLMKPLHPHALRHSYATQLLNSGSDLRVLQQLLGHQSLSATELYTHLNVDQLANTMENCHPLSKKN